MIFGFMLFSFLLCMAQEQQKPAQPTQPAQPSQAQVYPARMTPQMTEFFEPEVKIIQPAAVVGMPPSDAIILFDGSDVNKEWEDSKGNPTKWIVKDGALVCVKGSGVIQTKRKFNDFQLHIEWKSPSEVIGDGQGRGNSGVYLQGLYEVQAIIIRLTGRVRQAHFTSNMLLL
jgi:hypothetical protein